MAILLHRLLAQPLKLLAEQSAVLGHLAKRLPANRRLGLPVDDDQDGCELWKNLEGLQLTVVLMPKFCEPTDDRGTAALPIADGACILRLIALGENEEATAASEELRSQIAQLVLEKTVSNLRDGLLQQCTTLRLFRVYEVEEEKERAALLSWGEINSRWKQGVLFKRQDLPSIAFALRQTLPQEPVTLASEKLGDLLFGLKKVPTCDVDACSKVVLRQTDPAALAEVARRGQLLQFFLKSPSPADTSIRQAVSTLLHGQLPPPYGQPDLLVNAGASELIWARITNDVLCRQNESWRLVDHGLSSRIPENRWSEFALSAVDQNSVIRLLEEQTTGEETTDLRLNLTAAQREELLSVVNLANKSMLLKRLSIHTEYVNAQPDENDPRHSITERCYWYDGFGFPLPPAIHSHVTLLRLSDNAGLRAAQKELAPTWDAKGTVKAILKWLNPADHWKVLLEALGQIEKRPDELVDQLQNAAWLPQAGGGPPVRPCDVIYLKQIRERVSRDLARATTKEFVDYQDLHEDVCKPKNLAVLAKWLFPPRRQSLEMLGKVLGKDDAFHVGSPDKLTQPTALTRFCDVFHHSTDEVMAAASVVIEVNDVFGPDECVNGLLRPLCKALSVDRLKRILAFLRKCHKKSQGSIDRRAQVLEVYSWYLRELATHGQAFQNALADPEPVFLLSQADHWKNATELCLGTDDIDADYRLDEEQQAIIEPWLHGEANESIESVPAREQGADSSSKAAGVLEEYFKPWLEYRPDLRVVIGGFLAILGGEPKMKELATNYLKPNRTVTNVRLRLLAKNKSAATVDAEVDQVLVQVRIVQETSVLVNNLVGQQINVPLSPKVENLFVPFLPKSWFKPVTIQNSSKSYYRMRLRKFAPGDVGDEKLITLLHKAAQDRGRILQPVPGDRLG